MRKWEKNKPIVLRYVEGPLIRAAWDIRDTGKCKYEGYDCPSSNPVAMSPRMALSKAGRGRARDRGLPDIAVIIDIAVRLGIEQGIRLERTGQSAEEALHSVFKNDLLWSLNPDAELDKQDRMIG